MNYLVCSDCRGTNFITTRDADVVCTGCGLVAMERIMEDGPDWRTYENERAEGIEPKGWACKLLYDVDDIIDDVMKQNIDELWKVVYNPRASSKALFACCIYQVSQKLSRGWAVQQCINMVPGVDPKAFWNMYNIIGKNNHEHTSRRRVTYEDNNLAMCKRIIHDMDDVMNKKDIIKLTHKLCDAIKESGCQGSAKASKFCVAIVFSACKKLKMPIDEKKFCKQYDVSCHTLRKYYGVIQKIYP